jgi:hypothetical protein
MEDELNKKIKDKLNKKIKKKKTKKKSTPKVKKIVAIKTPIKKKKKSASKKKEIQKVEDKEIKTLTFPEPIPKETILLFKEKIKQILAKSPRRRKKSRGEKLIYEKKFCYKILDLFAEGKDKITIATELGVSYSQFCIWRKKYPEFNFSVKIGSQLSLRYWIETGRLNLFNDKFNNTLWMMNMSNRFKWFSSKSKDEKRIKRVDIKKLEVNIDDKRMARIVQLAENNKSIVEAGKLIANK